MLRDAFFLIQSPKTIASDQVETGPLILGSLGVYRWTGLYTVQSCLGQLGRLFSGIRRLELDYGHLIAFNLVQSDIHGLTECRWGDERGASGKCDNWPRLKFAGSFQMHISADFWTPSPNVQRFYLANQVFYDWPHGVLWKCSFLRVQVQSENTWEQNEDNRPVWNVK